MALEASFREFTVQLQKLHDVMCALHLTLGDKPVNRGAALADNFDDAVLKMMGTIQDDLRSALDAQKAVSNRLDLHRARRALTRCQCFAHELERTFVEDLSSYERLCDLDTLGRDRKGEWIPWGGSVKFGIENCREAIHCTNDILARCWEELVEHAGGINVSVHPTCIGQEITLPDGRKGARDTEPMPS